MYFPYLRGRQYELIALRELVERGIISDKIIPIIEPVRLSPTLVSTIETYKKGHKKLAFIVNPNVGTFINDINEKQNNRVYDNLVDSLTGNDNVLYLNLLQSNNNPKEFIDKYKDNMGTICKDRDAIPVFEKYFSEEDSKYNLILDESAFRRKINKNKVLLADRFNKKERNADYASNEDEAFSDDHLYYEEDGFIGFSDYSVIGEEYSDTGFSPYAVVIHIVYFGNDGDLRIRHFVSNSNDDISDPAGKFREALGKLVQWNKTQKLDTYAIKEFERMYREEIYSGLGTIKKLSIMHHIELMGQYLKEETGNL